MSEPTHFEKVADYVMSNDGSELSMVKAERDYALHCLERELDIAQLAQARIEVLKAALVDICELVDGYEDVDDGQPNLAMRVMTTAVAALEPEQDK